ncbi:hypothetical protein ACNKHN_14475 [Shigella flexneri]
MSAMKMYRTFNCGVGLVLALPAPEVDKALALLNAERWRQRGKSVSSKPLITNNAWLSNNEYCGAAPATEVIYRQLLTPVKPTKLKAPYGQFSGDQADAFGLEHAPGGYSDASLSCASAFDSREAYDGS